MCQGAAAELVTPQTLLPTSSAAGPAPCVSTTTPTGRPIAWPCTSTKPVKTSIGSPDEIPPANGTNMTLSPTGAAPARAAEVDSADGRSSIWARLQQRDALRRRGAAITRVEYKSDL